MDYIKLSQVFTQLALQAGDAIMQIYSKDNILVETKSDDSPVTNADKIADAIIYQGLKKAFPNTTIVTEEKSQSHLIRTNTFILVDPLDGTKEFIKKTGEFTVNIAYIDNGTPTHGIVYAPAIQRLFRTDHTGKSFESIKSPTNTSQYHDKPLLVSGSDKDALTVITSKSHNNAETDAYIAQYNVSKIINAGSSLKFCLIANGEADFYPRLGRTMEWDTAAGHAILLGAGGYVTNLSTQKALNYGKPGFENPFFIAHSSNQIIKT